MPVICYQDGACAHLLLEGVKLKRIRKGRVRHKLIEILNRLTDIYGDSVGLGLNGLKMIIMAIIIP